MALSVIIAILFPYALWRDLVSDVTARVSWCSAPSVWFPYALWRDLVSDPTLVGGAATSADAAGLHRPLQEDP